MHEESEQHEHEYIATPGGSKQPGETKRVLVKRDRERRRESIEQREADAGNHVSK